MEKVREGLNLVLVWECVLLSLSILIKDVPQFYYSFPHYVLGLLS